MQHADTDSQNNPMLTDGEVNGKAPLDYSNQQGDGMSDDSAALKLLTARYKAYLTLGLLDDNGLASLRRDLVDCAVAELASTAACHAMIIALRSDQ